jgi:hypothetical protein
MRNIKPNRIPEITGEIKELKKKKPAIMGTAHYCGKC